MFEEQSLRLTPVSNFGEFALIEHLVKDSKSFNNSVLKSIGDDAAVIEKNKNEVWLLTTDMLVEGVHFDLAYVPLQHLGYKSVVVNLSDIYAMNGKPEGVLVSFAVSNRFTVEALEDFYKGVNLACEHYGVSLLGGDSSTSRSGMFISVTAVGSAKKENVVYRSGAKETNLICVTGDLGAAYAGLQILEREKKVYLGNPEIQPDLVGYDYSVGRQLKPEARKDIIEAMDAVGIVPTAMIDLSDGLTSDLLHISKQSGVGAQLYQENIPIDLETGKVAEEFSIHSMTYAMNGGEDYELLFTVPITDHEKILGMKGVHLIGHITHADDGVFMVSKNSDTKIVLEAMGWNHFKE